MNQKLRYRLFQKLAQTQTAETNRVLPTPPTVPQILFSHLNEGFSSATVPLITQVSDILNDGVYYASDGYDSFQKFVNNNFSFDQNTTGAPEQSKLRSLSKRFYLTFLNGRNAFRAKVAPQTIATWCDDFTSSSEFTSLGQTNPTGQLAQKVPNLKTSIQDLMNQIKAQNPIR